MFSFFTRRKKIVVDCFTANPNAYDLFPIDKANKFHPDWWKRLPNRFVTESAGGIPLEQSTMKGCIGFKNLYSSGFVIPLWSDLKLQTHGQNYSFQFADNISQIGFHPLEQLGTEFSQYTHVKLVSPWRIMVHLIPLSENDVEIKLHLVGPNDIMRVMNNNSFPFFVNGYLESRRIRKKKEELKTSTSCPWSAK
jgi:hypothetical protein